MNQALEIYVLYFNPTDYPGKYVVRKWHNDIPEAKPLCVVNLLSEALQFLPAGLYEMPRQPGDDACIISTFF